MQVTVCEIANLREKDQIFGPAIIERTMPIFGLLMLHLDR